MSGPFAAHRFDGRYAVPVPVWVRIEEGRLIVDGLDGEAFDREALAHVELFEPYAHAPRLVVLPGGAMLEVRESRGELALALERAGVSPSWVVRLQARWPAVLAAVAVIVALCALAYFEGLPRATRWAAFALPTRLETRLGEGLLELFDRHGFEPSRLPPEKRARIAEQLARAAAKAAPGVRYRLEFRRTRHEAINAFALPGGIIVMLDATVDFGDEIDENAVLAVLGHELGHVAHKHGTRSVLQSVGVGTMGSLLWGDFSGTAASVPILIGQLGYSRTFEAEADGFAVALLRTQRLSARPLARFFACLQQLPEQRVAAEIPGFLSSHPSTQERLDRLQVLERDADEVCSSARTDAAR